MSLEWIFEGALCAEVDPALFMPSKGGTLEPAKRICRRCDVREACLEYALASEARLDGVWGGTSDRERRVMRARRGSDEGVTA